MPTPEQPGRHPGRTRAAGSDADPHSPPREASDALLLALMRTFRLVKRVHDQRIEPSQVWLLHTLHCVGPVRLSELAGKLQLDASTVSRQVRSLEQSGHVERTPDPGDGRANVLTLTPAGRQVLQESVEHRRSRLAAALRDWPATDLTTLESLLNRLGDTLEDDPTESSS